MNVRAYLAVLLTSLLCVEAHPEPYQLDPSEPAASALTLFDDPENEGVKLASHEGVLSSKAQRFYVKGYSEYQPVDIFLFSKSGNQNLEIGLLHATWEDRQQSCQTGTEGYCQLKFRSYDGVGLDVNGPAGTEFAIIVVVGAEVQPEFDSPFYKVTESDLDKLQDIADSGMAGSTTDADESSSNWLLYAIVVLLLLISALLGVMVIRQKAGAKTTLLVLLTATMLYGTDGSGAESDEEIVDRLYEDAEASDDLLEEIREQFERFQAALEELQHFMPALATIEELRRIRADIDSLSSSYDGLGHCIAAAPRFASPRIPSFCDYDYASSVSGVRSSDPNCATCFLDARTEFNETRATFARLETIYKCTKKMTTSAKAFGDSFSAATKTGVGWTSARKNIVASESRLEAAYDNKYGELIGRLHGSLIDMGICEAEYGLRDWYDRFGFVYYEFMADRYRRAD